MADTGRKRTTDKEGLKGKQRTYKREILAALFIILLVIGVAFRVNQIFYGYEADACNKAVMVDPQVYLGYAGSKVEKPKAPEFVVTVNVVFESNGNTLLYSKCFIPRIEIIDRATTLQKRAQLIEYKSNSQNGIATGFLANDHSVPVYSPDGDRLVARTLVRLGLIEE